MGLNYGFDIFIDRSKLWEFIDSVVELDKPSLGCLTTITFSGQQKVVPLWLSYERNLLSLDHSEQDDSFCLSIPFVIDDEIRLYMEGEGSQSPCFDNQGRVYIGCIYLSIVADLETIGRTGYDPNLVGFEFRAATNNMSRLFQNSPSIQQTFVELARKHESVFCMFSSGASDKAKVLWLDGKRCSVPIADDWLPMSEVRQLVSSSIHHES